MLLCRTALCLALVGCGRFGFSPAEDAMPAINCPSTYDVSLASSSSRYRVVAANAPVGPQHRSCTADASVGTHLVFVNDESELDELDAVLQTVPAPPLGRFYVGMVQLPGSPTLGAGWIDLTGQPLDPELWSPTEPDDLDDQENGLEQFAVIGSSRRLVDVAGATAYGAVCECDGQLLDAAAVALIP